MSRYRLAPTVQQESLLLEQCRHARFVWNIAREQWGMWSRGRRGYPPGFAEQCRQLTEARAECGWPRAGSQTVQQQALRDFDRAVADFFGGTRGRPRWRKAGTHEGFRIVGAQARRVERLSRKWGRVLVPKVGWVSFRLSRALTAAKSYVQEPGRGGAQKTGLNRGILANAWGMLVTRLEQKARDRIEKINPAYTSQMCSRCGTVDREARESQAVFKCRSCGHTANADVNAAVNIAAGRAVTARRGPVVGSEKREPQLATSV